MVTAGQEEEAAAAFVKVLKMQVILKTFLSCRVTDFKQCNEVSDLKLHPSEQAYSLNGDAALHLNLF